jgi:hypothetical protein
LKRTKISVEGKARRQIYFVEEVHLQKDKKGRIFLK